MNKIKGIYAASMSVLNENLSLNIDRTILHAENLIDQITKHAPNFRRSIQNYVLRTPLDLERENNLTDGCIWHIQHNGEQLFWNRPLPELSCYRSPIKGLYLCGAGQHPGGEVSGIPGHNAAHEIIKDLS